MERSGSTSGAAARGSDPRGDLLGVSTAWGDRWYDPAVGLLWNPAGSFAPVVRDASVHVLPPSAWYAFGLLERDRPGDLDRAVTVITSVLAQQYDRPGTPWHGTFARFAETPEPSAGAREWIDYDPNWRQFIGTTLLLVLRHHAQRLDQVLRSRIEAALDLAVRGEPDDRVDVRYTNVALMKAVLLVEFGSLTGDAGLVAEGEILAAAIVERFDRCGTFDEYNSPTYAGVDLLALAMWRTCAASEFLAGEGRRLEAAMWDELALFAHAGLGALAGPYDRAYGLDLHRYLSLVGLWWWSVWGRPAAPLPDVTADRIPHGHDLLAGPLVARLTGPVPPLARELFTRFEGVRQVERRIADDPDRVATAWLEADLCFGGEGGSPGRPAQGQAAPATVHWQLPPAPGSGRAIGTVRFACDDPTSARAADGVLQIVTTPAGPDPALAAFLISTGGEFALDPAMVGPGRWDLPGLSLRVHATGSLASVEAFGDDLLVTFRALAGGHRLSLRRVGGA
jgi:hypothetical protein